MVRHIDKDRTNSIDDIDNVIFDSWKVLFGEEFSKLAIKEIQESIDTEILKQILDSTSYIDTKNTKYMIDTCNNSLYRPELNSKV